MSRGNKPPRTWPFPTSTPPETKCGKCGSPMKKETKAVPHVYKERITFIPHVHGEFCTKCNEYLLGPEESRRVMDVISAFNQGLDYKSNA